VLVIPAVALFLWLRPRVHLGDDVGASHTEGES
jgi:hypothetical protein